METNRRRHARIDCRQAAKTPLTYGQFPIMRFSCRALHEICWPRSRPFSPRLGLTPDQVRARRRQRRPPRRQPAQGQQRHAQDRRQGARLHGAPAHRRWHRRRHVSRETSLHDGCRRQRIVLDHRRRHRRLQVPRADPPPARARHRRARGDDQGGAAVRHAAVGRRRSPTSASSPTCSISTTSARSATSGCRARPT